MLNLEEAAEELGVPSEAINWLIELGRIRLTIDTSSLPRAIAVKQDDISVEALRDINVLKRTINDFGFAAPRFIYTLPTRFSPIPSRAGIPTNWFETFDGEDFELFSESADRIMIKLGNDFIDAIGNATFSKEEISRYKADRKHETAIFRKRHDYRPFKLPLKVEAAAEAIVELGNQFFQEYGKIPIGPAHLRKYMAQNNGNPWDVALERDQIIVEGKPIGHDTFNKRYRSYLENNGK